MTGIGASLVLVLTLTAPPDPIDKALGYLAREGPAWRPNNGCFSCHNNGDATRALLRARRAGRDVPDSALTETLRWLQGPERWDQNGGDGPFSDKVLARVAFTAALEEAARTIPDWDRAPLHEASARLIRDQRPDGSWQGEGGESIGSPASYGATLATALALGTLERADAEGHAPAIAKARRWLEGNPSNRVTDAAAILLGLAGAEGQDAARRREQALEIIRAGQGADGGWGPYVRSASEPFDTALVLLAFAAYPPDEGVRDRIRRGRDYLIATQQDDGSWRETTRPSGGESYAQRVSTTAWAALALLATAAQPNPE